MFFAGFLFRPEAWRTVAWRTREFGNGRPPLGASVAEQLVALLAEKAAGHGNDVIALLENQAAGDQARPPFINFRAALAAVSRDVFLGNAENHGANSRPYAGAGAHGAGLVRRVQNKVGQVPAITAANVLQRFQFDVLDAGAGCLDAIARTGN